MSGMKSRLLYVLKYLWQSTDAEHYATTGDILTYLRENGISCDRKTIPSDIQKLCDIGIDIEEERSRENRYSLSSHIFTLPELNLLIDAVESSKFITTKKSTTGKLSAVAVSNANHRRILGINIFAVHHPVTDLHQGSAAIFLIPKAITTTCFCLLDKRMLRHGGHDDDFDFGVVLFDFCRSFQS